MTLRARERMTFRLLKMNLERDRHQYCYAVPLAESMSTKREQNF